jgi:hypothetical protein
MFGLSKLLKRNKKKYSAKVHPQQIIDYIKENIASTSSNETTEGVSSASILVASYIKMLDVHLPKNEEDFRSVNMDIKTGKGTKYQGEIIKHIRTLRKITEELMKQDINESVDVNKVSRAVAVSYMMINRIQAMIQNPSFSEFIRITVKEGIDSIADNKKLVILAKTTALKMNQEPQYVMRVIKMYLEYLIKRIDYALYFCEEVYISPRSEPRSDKDLKINRATIGREPSPEERARLERGRDMMAANIKAHHRQQTPESFNVRINKRRINETKRHKKKV